MPRKVCLSRSLYCGARPRGLTVNVGRAALMRAAQPRRMESQEGWASRADLPNDLPPTQLKNRQGLAAHGTAGGRNRIPTRAVDQTWSRDGRNNGFATGS